MPYSTEVLADSPVRYYRLDDAAGLSAADSSGNAGHGTLGAGGTKTRNQLSLMGSGEGACTKFAGPAGGSIPASADLSFGTDDFGIGGIAATTSNAEGIEIFAGNTGPDPWFVGQQYGKLKCYFGGFHTGTVYINDGRPRHLMIRRIGTTLTFWIDGALTDTFTTSAVVGNSTNATGISAYDGNGTNAWQGKLQELVFYKGSSVPSDARIAAHYAEVGGRLTMASSVTGVKAGRSGQIITLTGTGTNWAQGQTTFFAKALVHLLTGAQVDSGSVTSTTIHSPTSATLVYTSPDLVTVDSKVTFTDPDSRSVQVDIAVPYTIVNAAVGGTNARILVPDGYDPGAGAHLVTYHNGSGEGEEGITGDGMKQPTVNRLTANGYIVCTIAAGASAWGNDTALAYYSAFDAYLTANYTIRKQVRWSQSMGGLTGLRAIRDGIGTRVVGWFGVFPVCDILDVHDNSSIDFTANMYAAWGVADRAGLAAAIAGKNPTGFDGAEFAGFSMHFWHSPADTVVEQAGNTDVMRALVSPHARTSGMTATSGEHGDISNSDPDGVLAFVEAAVADLPAVRTYHHYALRRAA